MTDSLAASPPPLDPVVPAATADWHPLPARGALLHALGVGFAFALPAAFGVGLLASALLVEFGDLDGVLGAGDRISGAKRKQNLTEHAEDARVSKRLATMPFTPSCQPSPDTTSARWPR